MAGVRPPVPPKRLASASRVGTLARAGHSGGCQLHAACMQGLTESVLAMIEERNADPEVTTST